MIQPYRRKQRRNRRKDEDRALINSVNKLVDNKLRSATEPKS
jgi:hypothetical protein